MKLKINSNSKRRNSFRSFFIKATDSHPSEYYENLLKEAELRNGWDWHKKMEESGIGMIH